MRAVAMSLCLIGLSACGAENSPAASERYIQTEAVKAQLEKDPDRAMFRESAVRSCSRALKATVERAGKQVSESLVANSCECAADAAMVDRTNDQLLAQDVNPDRSACDKWAGI